MSFPKSDDLHSLTTSDLTKLIPGTQHSFQTLINQLINSNGFLNKLKNKKIKLIKSLPIDGQGLMSHTFKICILLEENEEEFNAILKVTTTQKLERFRPGEIKAFDNVSSIIFEFCQAEADFYELALPHFLKDKELAKILPKLYALRRSPDKIQIEKGFVLIEDMSYKGISPNIYEGLNNEQAIK
uniref:Uncharacterized protein n=1 Tax=Meloidogyne enterolobii TaxID=390850 RepID=A0A6V7VTE2_MELEN|nr:unnamed protein product [Meloidogyne enterolobii]